MEVDGLKGDWRFGIEHVGGPIDWFPARMKDEYLNGFFWFRWFFGWMR